MSKILILASNPRKDLDLHREINHLRSIIDRSGDHSQFDVVIEAAVRPEQVQSLLLKHRPRIVHFSGHGAGEEGLILENDAGQMQFVRTQALSNVFKNFASEIECVLLNACYSEVQANAVTEHINYVIGMNQAIQDKAAIEFTRGFYQALGYGESIEQSYNLGCNAIEMGFDKALMTRAESVTAERKFILLNPSEATSLPEHRKPVLKTKAKLTVFPKQSIFQNEGTDQRYREDVQNDFNLGQAPLRTRSLTRQQYRQRQSLLSHVKSSWIEGEGVLEKSLHNRTLLKLDLERRPGAVQHSSRHIDESPTAPKQSLEWLRTTHIFEQMGTGRTLLILGDPGSGKTIELLTLAKRLIERAEKDLNRPIPVVFNLSSWAAKRLSIADWLVEELKDQYRASKTLGAEWVKQEELLLLLDGLDEVQAEHRNACVRALNQFLEDHSTTEVVVCSRLKDYEKLSEQLKLLSAIYIRPITPEYIDWYLEDVGTPLAGLKTVLSQDKELEEFAQTPLILNVMSWAYHGYSAEKVLHQLGSAEHRRQRLFGTYIERMFDRKEFPQIYSPQQTQRWLTWLAQRMEQTSQTSFLIEKLQPRFLQKRTERIAYQFAQFTFIPLMMFIILLILGLILQQEEPLMIPSVFTFIFVGIRCFYIFGMQGDSGREAYQIWDIETVETLKWSWKEARRGWISTKRALSSLRCDGLEYFAKVLLTLLFCPFMVMIFGFRGPTIPEDQGTPNIGIRKSVLNAGIFGLVVLAPIMLLCSSILFSPEPDISLFLTVVAGLGVVPVTFSVIAGGGDAVIKHLILRFILYCKGYSPWNYIRFLNYATDRLFVKQSGRSYIFIHRMLQEHFANLPVSNKQ